MKTTTETLNINVIYKSYFGLISRYVHQKISDKMNAEELVSDVFIKVNTSLHRYDGNKAKFSTWIFTIAKNVLIDHFRKKSLNVVSIDVPAFDDGNGDSVLEHIPVPTLDMNPLETLIDNIEMDKIHSAIAELPENLRELITLYALKGKSYTEMSKYLDIPLGTMKARLHTARVVLRQILTSRAMAVAE